MGDGGPPVVSAGSDAPPPPRRREQIANASDLYLEQLKADTKSRKESFLLGDYDGYQSVWVNPKIKELEKKIVDNPYFQSEKERQKQMMEMFEPTEEDLMIQELEEREAEEKKFSTGVSYKERLAAKKGVSSVRKSAPTSASADKKASVVEEDAPVHKPLPHFIAKQTESEADIKVEEEDEFTRQLNAMKENQSPEAAPVQQQSKVASELKPMQSSSSSKVQDEEDEFSKQLKAMKTSQSPLPKPPNENTMASSTEKVKFDPATRMPPPREGVNFDELALTLGEQKMSSAAPVETPTESSQADSGTVDFDALAERGGQSKGDAGPPIVDFDALAARGRMSMGDGGPPVVSAGSDAPPPPRRREQIANASDLYLEQLKADTKSRKESFLLGDYDGYQSVWVNPKIKELEKKIVDNPYFQSEKERQKQMMEMFEPTEEDLMIQELEEREAEEKKFSTGVSYKERLAEKRNKGKAKQPESNSQPVASAIEEGSQNEPFVIKVPEPEQVANLADVPKSKFQDEVEPVAQLQPEQPFVMKTPEPINNPTEVAKQSNAEPVDDETARRAIRTLMGLILKHRGGPGFGAGYLKGPETSRFENTLAEVSDMLRSEIVTPTAPMVEESSSTELEPSSLKDDPITSPTRGLAFPLEASLECVDAVVRMYQQSSSEQQADLLVPLRDALVSAVTRCNLLIDANISDQEVKEERTNEVESLDEIASRMDFTAVEEKSTQIEGSPNTALFQKTREALLEMRGDGEYGMKNSCTEEEASDLVDLLSELRFVLMDELEAGAA